MAVAGPGADQIAQPLTFFMGWARPLALARLWPVVPVKEKDTLCSWQSPILVFFISILELIVTELPLFLSIHPPFDSFPEK